MSVIDTYKTVITNVHEEWSKSYSDPLNLSNKVKKVIASEVSKGEIDIQNYIKDLNLRIMSSYGDKKLQGIIVDTVDRKLGKKMTLTAEHKQRIGEDIFLGDMSLEKVKEKYIQILSDSITKEKLIDKYFILSKKTNLEFDTIFIESIVCVKEPNQSTQFVILELPFLGTKNNQIAAEFIDNKVSLPIGKQFTLSDKIFQFKVEPKCVVNFLAYYPSQ